MALDITANILPNHIMLLNMEGQLVIKNVENHFKGFIPLVRTRVPFLKKKKKKVVINFCPERRNLISNFAGAVASVFSAFKNVSLNISCIW